MIRERVQEGERVHVGAGGAALEITRIGLDPVEQGGCEARRDLGIGRAQVLGEDRRGRAVLLHRLRLTTHQHD